MRSSYFGLMTEVEQHSGRIINHLRATGQYNETLIVFTVDHGEMLGDHRLLNKGGYFDQSYHIPLLIRDPRRAGALGHSGIVEQFTGAVDIMPTILDWLSQERPAQCDGESLPPLDGIFAYRGLRR